MVKRKVKLMGELSELLTVMLLAKMSVKKWVN